MIRGQFKIGLSTTVNFRNALNNTEVQIKGLFIVGWPVNGFSYRQGYQVRCFDSFEQFTFFE